MAFELTRPNYTALATTKNAILLYYRGAGNGEGLEKYACRNRRVAR